MSFIDRDGLEHSVHVVAKTRNEAAVRAAWLCWTLGLLIQHFRIQSTPAVKSGSHMLEH